MQKIAFVTYNQMQHPTADDNLAVKWLHKHGIEVESVCWDAPHIQWEQFDQIILRSCWDYHLRIDEFKSWIKAMQSQKNHFYNPCEVVQWNMDKSYLAVFAQKGVSIPPTLWLHKGEKINLAEALQAQNWDRAVVKPTVSASAYQTWLTSFQAATQHQQQIDAMLEKGGVMIQKFVKQIQTQGEWSVIFFNKKFSHAVLKRAKASDFRVQTEYGGTTVEMQPSAAILQQAQQVIDLIEVPLLYARIDGVMVENNFVLIEAELIEPALFLSHHPAAPKTFADAILDVV